MQTNVIHTGDNAEVLKSFPDGCIDLTVTSPPYDNLRDYKGYSFNFEALVKELLRVTKIGGVVVWVVGDSTVDGSESLSSFRQAIGFQETGFNVHDTMIYKKSGIAYPSFDKYYQQFEYMFIFSKGKPNTFNPLKDRKNRWSGSWSDQSSRMKNGELKSRKKVVKTAEEYGVRSNIWEIHAGAGYGQTDKIAYEHPATFPEALANDHILSWSNEGDIVLDCFAGSGTTLKMAKLLSRQYIGIEISQEYVSLAEKRLLATNVPLFGLGRGLTPREPDNGDSAPSQAFSQPEFLSDLEGLS